MFLLAQNKVLSYINQHPESRVPLMLWLNSYASRRMFSHDSIPPNASNGHGTASADGYEIETQVNHTVKTELITWVGTVAENRKRRDQKINKMLKYYRDRGVTVESSYEEFTSIGTGKSIKADKTAFTVNSALKDKLAALAVSPEDVVYFKTKAEYEVGLKNAIRLFKSRPSSADFSNLCTLLPAIHEYEKEQLDWPKVENYEYVKIRMDLFKMTSSDFRDIVPLETDFELYLLGELKFTATVLKRLFARLGLRFLLKRS